MQFAPCKQAASHSSEAQQSSWAKLLQEPGSRAVTHNFPSECKQAGGRKVGAELPAAGTAQPLPPEAQHPADFAVLLLLF